MLVYALLRVIKGGERGKGDADGEGSAERTARNEAR